MLTRMRTRRPSYRTERAGPTRRWPMRSIRITKPPYGGRKLRQIRTKNFLRPSAGRKTRRRREAPSAARGRSARAATRARSARVAARAGGAKRRPPARARSARAGGGSVTIPVRVTTLLVVFVWSCCGLCLLGTLSVDGRVVVFVCGGVFFCHLLCVFLTAARPGRKWPKIAEFRVSSC